MEKQKVDTVRTAQLDNDIADVLTAISVISKRLAKKLRMLEMQKEGENNNVNNEATGSGA